MSTALAAQEIVAGYGSEPIVRGVSINLAVGEIVTLLGQNGAGKSTLLRVLAGVLEPISGKVHLGDQEITHWSPRQRVRSGLVFAAQSRELYPSLSAEENLRVACLPIEQGSSAYSTAIERALEVFPELVDLQQRPARELSGGQQQALVLAMALTQSPRCLLLDEPTMGLAPVARTSFERFLKLFAHEGGAVLMVEQNPRVAAEVSQTIHLLAQGKFAMSGPASEIIHSPAFRERYLGLAGKNEG